MGEFSTYLETSRHIFSVCPECDSVSRLTELELGRRGKYVADWLDRIESGIEKTGQDKFALEQRAKELRDAARKEAEAELLPRRLREIAPTFANSGFDPRDVSAILDPVQFVIFEGMNSADGVRNIVFFSRDGSGTRFASLRETIRGHAFDWNLVRVADDGAISQSKKFASSKRNARLSEF